MTGLYVAMVRPGEYVAAVDDRMVGRVLTCAWHKVEAVALDGRSLGLFDSLMAAGEVLALDFAWHYGEKVSA